MRSFSKQTKAIESLNSSVSRLPFSFILALTHLVLRTEFRTGQSYSARLSRFLPFTGVNLFSLSALFAFDVAAPAYLALARSRHHSALSVVAPAAADGLAVLVLVALARRRARRILAGPAKARRVLDVKEIGGAGNGVRPRARRGLLPLGSALGDFRLPGGFVGGAAHFDGGLVALLELLADLVKGRQLPPAGLHRARARHSVTFAGGLHSCLDHLGGANVNSGETKRIKDVTVENLSKRQQSCLQLSQQTQHRALLRHIKDVFTKPSC